MFKKKINSYFFLVCIFSVIAVQALLHVGLPPTHDGEYHVVRFYEFDKTLRSGDWYPRWAPDLNKGYGIPLFNYVYPLPNYISSFLHVFGVNFIDAFKLNMFFATIVGSISMYAWARKFWGEKGGVVSSVFYTFSPYHFVDIYIRGSVGEVWALALFPAFLWSITNVIKKKNKIFIIFSGLFLAFIIFSHNILALMFFSFGLSYILFLILLNKEKLYSLRFTLYAFFLGLGLSAIFWFPALLETGYVTGLQIYSVGENFPELYQLLIPSWGSGFSEGSLEGQMSFQIGIANLTAVLLSTIAAIVIVGKKEEEKTKIIVFFLAWFVVIFFLMLPASLLVWEFAPLLNYFQFPWRMLSLIILLCSFLAGSVVLVWRFKIIYFVFLIFPIILGIGYAKPAYYHQREDDYYLTRSNFIDGTNSPGNLFNTVWFDRNLDKQNEKITAKNGLINMISIRPTWYSFSIESAVDTYVIVNTAYFPGWQAVIDSKEVKVKPSDKGLITFPAPKGKHEIVVKFKNTLTRSIGESISLLSWLIIFVYIAGYISRLCCKQHHAK